MKALDASIQTMSYSSRTALLSRRFLPLQSTGRRKCLQLSNLHGSAPVSKHWPYLGGRRYAITLAGDDKTGHIEAGPNEGILFFSNVFPLKLQWLFFSERLVQRFQKDRIDSTFGIADTIKKAMPSNLPAKVSGIIPRFNEGGAFVRFSHDEHILSSEIEGILKEHLRTDQIQPWWNPFSRVHVGLIRGRPWVEDLRRRPSCRLKIEFVPSEGSVEAAELSQEQLYSILRPYGTLTEINPQPADSKILPKYASVEFARTKRSIMAKNCLHGFTVLGEDGKKVLTKLKISYERNVKPNWIMDWIVNHPRIVIPLIAALVAIITVAVFDPIRTFFIKSHITRAFHISDNRIYKWFRSQANDLRLFRRRQGEDAGMVAIREERKEGIEQIQKWLLETTDTFIVVQGARGSGKRDLVVNQALKDRKNKLVIDCKSVQEARGDSATIDAMALEVGYRPVFSWMNSISGLIDLAAQGATGMKTGFSETLDSQLQKILNNTATALKEIGLDGRKKEDTDANLSEDAYLEAHPETRPVVIIDNFLHKSQESGLVYDKLSEWAARIVSANIAHVIFLTTDISYSKSLSKALPDRVFRQLSLGDFTPEAAKRYVVSHLQSDSVAQNDAEPTPQTEKGHDLLELDSCLAYLGGRLTDLEFLARRVKSGQPPREAVREIIDQSSSEILKMYVLNTASDASSRGWNQQQAWELIKLLAAVEPSATQPQKTSQSTKSTSDTSDFVPIHPGIRYSAATQSAVFVASPGDPAAVLSALEQAELITITSHAGRPSTIRPGKPVFGPAFHQLTKDPVLTARLELARLSLLISTENTSIDKIERELALLAELQAANAGGGMPKALGGRVRYLLEKARGCQVRIEGYESEQAGFKGVLAKEF